VSRLAIVEPKTLMGEAVRDGVASPAGIWDEVELFTTDEEEVGGVTEAAGRAALVQALQEDALDAFDVVLFCGQEIHQDVLDTLPATCRAIFVDPASPVDGAVPVVAGINSEEISAAPRVLSPAPAVILLSHLLAPLRRLGSLEVVAHILQPASARGKAGVDELFEQTRSILTMSEDRPEDVFGTQLAFNLLPWGGASNPLAAQLETILGTDLEVRIQLSQAGVFHCCSAGIFLSTAQDPGAAELQEILLESPLIERAEDPEHLGPVSAATQGKILISDIAPSPVKGYWIWSSMDNLAACADNALSLARS
jgi:aspartate-semialdehyde dehydrogenase